ncbi:MAG: amidohydrolase [Myxococcota bacterium]
MTAAGPTLTTGDVLIRDGRIVAVAPALDPPAEARIVDLSGKWVTPGLIDPHSHLGVYALPRTKAHSDVNEKLGSLQAAVRAEEGFWPQDPTIRRAVAGGVTTVLVLPGSSNLVGGQGVTLRLRPVRAVREMRFEGAPPTMKMACGENPKRGKKGGPSTRMGESAMLRQTLEQARAYGVTSASLPAAKAHDFSKQALARVLSGEILIQNHCYRADDMLRRLDLLDEFDVRPRAFHHATEAYKIAGRLAGASVGAVVWSDWWVAEVSKMEMLDMVPASAALLDVAGVRVALHSDSPEVVQRLNQEAARALAAGLRAGLEVDRDRAIRWVTANPAWVLGIEERVGTLEPGKDADLVVWSGDPFSVYSVAEQVYIEGVQVYDREQPELYPVSDFELGLGGPE